jgi:hypothetical protein
VVIHSADRVVHNYLSPRRGLRCLTAPGASPTGGGLVELRGSQHHDPFEEVFVQGQPVLVVLPAPAGATDQFDEARVAKLCEGLLDGLVVDLGGDGQAGNPGEDAGPVRVGVGGEEQGDGLGGAAQPGAPYDVEPVVRAGAPVVLHMPLN